MLTARTLTPSNPPKKKKKRKLARAVARESPPRGRGHPTAQAKEGRPSGGTRQQDSKGGSFTSIVSFSYLVPYVLVRAGEDDASHWGWSREWRHPGRDILCPAAGRRTEAQAMLRMDAMPCLTSAVTPSTEVRFEGGRLVSNAAVAAALRSRPACPGAACGCSRRGCSSSICCLQQSRYCHLKMKIPLAVANSRMNSLSCTK